ncbi:YbiU family protein [Microbacterium sp. LWH11-1.2]|uniref:YbiU family protein n=4 Tax=Bacillati TaxID=1783272 RepID=UPI00313A0D01
MTEQTSWATPPEDFPSAVRAVKKMLREQIGDVAGLFARIEAAIEPRVIEIEQTRERGEDVWPIVQYADIEAGTVPQETIDLIHRRGCAVVRGQVSPEQATEWDRSLVEYVDSNDFMSKYRGPGDDFFGNLDASKPEIYPIYWSTAQMEARQHEHTAKVQSFLNRMWKSESRGVTWFDPDQDSMYPDRIRRRPPGTSSNGLGAHTDSGSVERWLTPAYQQVFESIFHGDFDSYDPWDAAFRTEVDEYPSSTMCSVFRSFQGWLAMSEMAHDQGVLWVVPIPEAMAYILVRALLDDVPEDELAGAQNGKALAISDQWHPLLMRARAGIPTVQPGDSVWWHSDMIHGVAAVENQEGWGNVIYIPAAPMCAKNAAYAKDVAERFRRGESPADFPKEDYEVEWANRFQEDHLNQIGARGLGITRKARPVERSAALPRP